MSRIEEPGTARTADDERVAAIEAEFPRWQAWVSDTGRWWAAVRSTLTAGQTAAGGVPYLRGGGADELVQRIREQEELLSLDNCRTQGGDAVASNIPRADEIAVRAQRNRDILAERLNWPAGVADELRDLETRYPEWTFGYSRGGLPAVPDPVFTAQLRGHQWNATRLEAAAADELEELVLRADGNPPPFVSAF